MSMRTPIKSRTVRLSITVQESINLQALLCTAMELLDDGKKERYHDLLQKLQTVTSDAIDKAISEEKNS